MRQKSRPRVDVDPNVMPFIMDTSGLELQAAAEETPEYDMNMRNYLASKPLLIKSIR